MTEDAKTSGVATAPLPEIPSSESMTNPREDLAVRLESDLEHLPKEFTVEQWPPGKPAHFRLVGDGEHGFCSVAVYYGEKGAERLAAVLNNARQAATTLRNDGEEIERLRGALRLAHDLCLSTAPKQAVGEVLARSLLSPTDRGA